jgi:hypothetical protein
MITKITEIHDGFHVVFVIPVIFVARSRRRV